MRISSLILIVGILLAPTAKADLKHGTEQLLAMLEDRPAMKSHVTLDGKPYAIESKDAPWKWVARKYGGRVNGAIVNWNGSDFEKQAHYVAQHQIPINGKPGFIRIRAKVVELDGTKRNIGFEESWSACVFEQINIRNHWAFREVTDDALKGKVNREEWILRTGEIEHGALLQLRDYYFDSWKPWALENRLITDEKYWYTRVPKDYRVWLKQFEGTGLYDYWGDYYDKSIVPYLKRQEGQDKPLKGNQ